MWFTNKEKRLADDEMFAVSKDNVSESEETTPRLMTDDGQYLFDKIKILKYLGFCDETINLIISSTCGGPYTSYRK